MFQTAVIIIVAVMAICWLFFMRREEKTDFKHNAGWFLLFLSGLLFVPGGFAWLIRWIPTPGPYMVGEIYPFGGHIEAWQVSMGFAFVAFGMIFSGLSVLACKLKNKWTWLLLLTGWILLMFPHILIGITFILDDITLSNLGVAAYAVPFFLLWAAMTFIGFVLSGRDVFKVRKGVSAE
jgi:hypothetical protein